MIKLIINQELAAIPDQLSQKVIRKIESTINEVVLNVPNGTIAISFVSDEEIRRVNRIYRKKDQVTDVLSFSYLDNEVKTEEIGEIIISLEQAKRQQSEGLEYELVDLIVHGILHILGYDHEKAGDSKIMFPLQDLVVSHII